MELRDPTAHAEVMALRNAGAALGRHLFEDGVMYASSEPCPMCLCACYWVRLPRLLFGATSYEASNWKLYELNGRFYRGRPKDGSIRDADIPSFLADLLEWQLDTHPDRKCSCRNEDAPWCPSIEYVFLTPAMPTTADRTTPPGSCGPPPTPGIQAGKDATAARPCRCSSTRVHRGPAS